jgi:hypothetical protein
MLGLLPLAASTPRARELDVTRTELSPTELWEGAAKADCERQWTHATRELERTDLKHASRTDNMGTAYLSGPKPNFLFVHVGKTCGGTVAATLQQRYVGPQPGWAEVHVHPVRQEVLEAADRVLLVLRDPVDRVISAFNTAACIDEAYDGEVDVTVCKREATGRLTRKPNFDELIQHTVFDCFPNVTVFADGIDDDSDCGRRARESLLDYHLVSEVGIPAHTHFFMGACFYLGGLLEQLKGKSVHVVNSETCDDDIAAIPRWLGQNASMAAVEAHTGSFPHHEDTVSAEGRRRLRRHLAHEYAFISELEALSGRR